MSWKSPKNLSFRTKNACTKCVLSIGDPSLPSLIDTEIIHVIKMNQAPKHEHMYTLQVRCGTTCRYSPRVISLDYRVNGTTVVGRDGRLTGVTVIS